MPFENNDHALPAAEMYRRLTKPQPFGENQKIRVLVNGIGVYCRIKDIASRDILRVVEMINEERSAGKTTIGLVTNINGQNIQVDVVK